MRGAEIITAIPWSPDTDAATRIQVEDAIRALDAAAYGNARPTLGPMDVHRRLEAFVRAAGSANAAAGKLGISKSFLSDIRNSRRPAPAGVLGALGVCKSPRRSREMYLEL